MHSEMQCTCCGITIRWQPTIIDGNIYCCLGCAQGGPCECDYDQLPENDQIRPMVLRVLPVEGEVP
jgi:hypothetical protein